MDLTLDRLKSLPDAQAWPLYRAMWYADIGDPEIHLHGALIAQRLGRLHSAHAAILEGLATQPPAELLGRMRFVLATILREIGNIDEAITQFTTWLRDLEREYPALIKSHLGAAHYNRGLAFRQAMRYHESLADYVQAAQEFRRWDRPVWLCMALHNLAWAACLSEQPASAIEALEEAKQLSVTPSFAWHQKIGEALLAATGPNGDLHRVMALCREIIDCTDADVPNSVRSHAYWLAGRVAKALDLPTDATIMAERAMLWGAAAGDENRCLADAQALWRELHAQRNVTQ